MRNPRESIQRMPKAKNVSWQIRELFYKTQELWPSLIETAKAILKGEAPSSMDERVIQHVRDTVIKMIGGPTSSRTRTARAQTPLQANVIEAWGKAAGDPDSEILARWLDHGAPLGFTQDIETCGVFPIAEANAPKDENLNDLVRSLEGWQNYQSAIEEQQDLQALIEDYVKRGFCHKAYREGADVWLAAVDIKDAFLNVPAGPDKFMTTSSVTSEDGRQEILIFDVLVFGSGSSPTIWSRFAAWLGRSSSAICPTTGLQIYVDDPAMVLQGNFETAAKELTNFLLWCQVSGFPIKLDKAEGGKVIHWVGAKVTVDDNKKNVTVSIPEDKIEKVQGTTQEFLRRPVVGHKQLRSYTGSLSFIAGLVPHLRPFLSSLWAVLTSGSIANDGASRPSGKLLHTRRFRPAVKWIEALLQGGPAPLERTLESKYTSITATITTDASPWGIGGVLRIGKDPVECFASPIPSAALTKFKAAIGNSKYNTLWEGLALLVAFRLWLPKLGYGAQVRAKSDNLGVLYMLVSGRAKAADLNVLAEEFALDQALRLYSIGWLLHIPGITNLEADALSRQDAPSPPEWPKSLTGVKVAHVEVDSNFWRIKDP
eukprot:s2656_g5.t1